MWHFSFTMAVGGELNDHFFQYFGPELASVFGEDYTGSNVAEAVGDSELLSNTLGFYLKVIETAAPLSESSSFFMNGKEVPYRAAQLRWQDHRLCDGHYEL